MAGMNRSVAVPAVVSCAVPKRCESSQCGVAASQKRTWPGLTGVVPAKTVAIKVTTAPAAADVTGVPAAVSASEVVVGAFATLYIVVADEARQLLTGAPGTVLVSFAQASK